ncbi:GTP-binding protein, partial [Ruminococcus sp.]|uniref:TIGR03943 family putative permease subunit n=1 Tax=Ruminococcus sp. TaxID=41978 RepID=UPI0025EB6979
MKKIPVYLFLGFLEGGKTSFIQKTLANEHFGNDENILLLVCEEGLEEYDFSELGHNNVSLHVIEEKTELDEQSLSRLSDECEANRIVIELNGIWHLTDFLLKKPDNWLIFQTVFVADASSFSIYVKNLKSLVVDKLNVSDVVIFNRYVNKADVNELHKIVHSVNRRAEIYYEADNGMMIADDIEDPLPYDIDADTILIKDEDYAIWYGDIMNEAKKYNDKTIKFKAMITSRPELPNNVFAVGRYIMTCCEADMNFCWFIALCNRYYPLQGEKWVSLTAEITVQHHETQNIDI